MISVQDTLSTTDSPKCCGDIISSLFRRFFSTREVGLVIRFKNNQRETILKQVLQQFKSCLITNVLPSHAYCFTKKLASDPINL
ncbi:hypothetical protein ACJMK2_036426, partial [Sinanodonta woodiana]